MGSSVMDHAVWAGPDHYGMARESSTGGKSLDLDLSIR